MGLIILIVPLIIYYSIVVPLVNRGIIEKIENQRKKAIFFWLLVLFPIADHIVGYVVYKALCFSVGGVHIYKTVTDVEAQRAYWIDSYFGIRAQSIAGEHYGIESRIYLTKDLKQHQTVYINQCKTKRWQSYDCEKAKEYIEKNRLKIYEVENEKIDIPRSTLNQDYIQDSSIRITRVIGDTTLEPAYLNYCNDTCNTLSKEHENYKKSCTNADELIAQYRLENVIKVPKSQYRLNVKDYDFSIPILNIEIAKDYGENTATKDKLYISVNFVFRGGWYIKYIGRYVLDMPFWVACNKGVVNREYREQYEKVGVPEIVIPNPYKQSN